MNKEVVNKIMDWRRVNSTIIARPCFSMVQFPSSDSKREGQVCTVKYRLNSLWFFHWKHARTLFLKLMRWKWGYLALTNLILVKLQWKHLKTYFKKHNLEDQGNVRVILKSTKWTTGTPNLRGIFLPAAVISNYMLSFIRPMIVTRNCGNIRINPQKVRPKSQLSLQVTNSM